MAEFEKMNYFESLSLRNRNFRLANFSKWLIFQVSHFLNDRFRPTIFEAIVFKLPFFRSDLFSKLPIVKVIDSKLYFRTDSFRSMLSSKWSILMWPVFRGGPFSKWLIFEVTLLKLIYFEKPFSNWLFEVSNIRNHQFRCDTFVVETHCRGDPFATQPIFYDYRFRSVPLFEVTHLRSYRKLWLKKMISIAEFWKLSKKLLSEYSGLGKIFVLV